MVATTVRMLHRVHGHTTHLHQTREIGSADVSSTRMHACTGTLCTNNIHSSTQLLRKKKCYGVAQHGAVWDELTFGQLLRLTLNLWYALPAFSNGFSVRPPPATCPTIARHVLGSTCTTSPALSRRATQDSRTLLRMQGWFDGNSHNAMTHAALSNHPERTHKQLQARKTP